MNDGADDSKVAAGQNIGISKNSLLTERNSKVQPVEDKNSVNGKEVTLNLKTITAKISSIVDEMKQIRTSGNSVPADKIDYLKQLREIAAGLSKSTDKKEPVSEDISKMLYSGMEKTFAKYALQVDSMSSSLSGVAKSFYDSFSKLSSSGSSAVVSSGSGSSASENRGAMPPAGTPSLENLSKSLVSFREFSMEIARAKNPKEVAIEGVTNFIAGGLKKVFGKSDSSESLDNGSGKVASSAKDIVDEFSKHGLMKDSGSSEIKKLLFNGSPLGLPVPNSALPAPNAGGALVPYVGSSLVDIMQDDKPLLKFTDKISGLLGNGLFGDNSAIVKGAKSFFKTAEANWVGLATKIVSAVANILDQIDKQMLLFAKEQSTMSAYLQNLRDEVGAKTYWEHVGKAVYSGWSFTETGAIEGTGLFKYSEYLASLQKMASSGYIKDMDARAFLATMRDQLVPTFDLENDTLLRILKLVEQGNSNSTGQRLALQGHLLKYLNTYYEDSTYLKGVFTSIESNLTDSIALKSNAESLTYESAVQAWTAGLYSSGVSSDAVNKIAKGIDALASGNVQALTGDSGIQTLFGVGAARSGLSLADMLINGIKDSEISVLMREIVTYLADISNSSNNVVRSEYAKIFGVTVADLVGISNFVEKGLPSIEQSILDTEAKVTTEFSKQLTALFNASGFLFRDSARINGSAYIENVLENIVTQAAVNIGNNPGKYALYKAADFVYEAGNVLGMFGQSWGPAVGVAAKALQVVGTLTSLTKSFFSAVETTITGGINGYGVDIYNKLSDGAYKLTKAQLAYQESMTSDTAAIEKSIKDASEDAAEEDEKVKRKSKKEEGEVQSAEDVAASTNAADTRVNVVSISSIVLMQLASTIASAISAYSPVNGGSSDTEGSSSGSSSSGTSGGSSGSSSSGSSSGSSSSGSSSGSSSSGESGSYGSDIDAILDAIDRIGRKLEEELTSPDGSGSLKGYVKSINDSQFALNDRISREFTSPGSDATMKSLVKAINDAQYSINVEKLPKILMGLLGAGELESDVGVVNMIGRMSENVDEIKSASNEVSDDVKNICAKYMIS